MNEDIVAGMSPGEIEAEFLKERFKKDLCLYRLRLLAPHYKALQALKGEAKRQAALEKPDTQVLEVRP